MNEVQKFFDQVIFESFGIASDEDGEMGMTLVFSDSKEDKTYYLNIGADKTMQLL